MSAGPVSLLDVARPAKMAKGPNAAPMLYYEYFKEFHVEFQRFWSYDASLYLRMSCQMLKRMTGRAYMPKRRDTWSGEPNDGRSSGRLTV
jgi:hypothetical protein